MKKTMKFNQKTIVQYLLKVTMTQIIIGVAVIAEE